jgi:uncharacterized repeat protein (TIGR01451 family)
VSGTPPTGTTSFAYSVIATNGVAPDATAGPFTVAVSAAAGSGADLSVTLSAPATATKGTTITYTAVVRNSGPAPALKVLVALAAGPGLSFVGATPPGVRHDDSLWSWSLPSLAPGQSQTFTLTVTATRAGIVLAGAAVGSATRDPKLANNLAAVRTIVR